MSGFKWYSKIKNIILLVLVMSIYTSAKVEFSDFDTSGKSVVYEISPDGNTLYLSINPITLHDHVDGIIQITEQNLAQLSQKLDGEAGDQAILSGDKVKKGGIDLNPSVLELKIKRDDEGMPLPVLQQPLMDMQVDGFIPIIINISPISSLQMLLGESGESEDEDQQISFAAPTYYDRIEVEELELV